MALDWPSVGLKDLESGQVRPAFLMRIETDPVIRIWSGVGALTIGVDALETDADNLYQGVGELLGLPAVDQLVNGVAQRVEFTLSGDAVTAQVIRNKDVSLGFFIFDRDWQIAAPTAWLWFGVADSLVDAWDGGSGEIARSISLSVGSIFTARKRPGHAYFTDADQRRRSGDDAFFDQVAKYNAGSTKVWPA
jgi:hypothetical protein